METLTINGLTLPVPIPDKEKKKLFSLLCGASKGYMWFYVVPQKGFIKPFKAP